MKISFLFRDRVLTADATPTLNGDVALDQHQHIPGQSTTNSPSNYSPSFHQSTQSHSTANGRSSYTTATTLADNNSTSSPNNTRYSSANTSHSSLDTSALSIADVEANRARFVRLTQDFQKIHEGSPSIEEETGGGGHGMLEVGKSDSIPMRSPIELSDDGSDGESLSHSMSIGNWADDRQTPI